MAWTTHTSRKKKPEELADFIEDRAPSNLTHELSRRVARDILFHEKVLRLQRKSNEYQYVAAIAAYAEEIPESSEKYWIKAPAPTTEYETSAEVNERAEAVAKERAYADVHKWCRKISAKKIRKSLQRIDYVTSEETKLNEEATKKVPMFSTFKKTAVTSAKKKLQKIKEIKKAAANIQSVNDFNAFMSIDMSKFTPETIQDTIKEQEELITTTTTKIEKLENDISTKKKDLEKTTVEFNESRLTINDLTNRYKVSSRQHRNQFTPNVYVNNVVNQQMRDAEEKLTMYIENTYNKIAENLEKKSNDLAILNEKLSKMKSDIVKAEQIQLMAGSIKVDVDMNDMVMSSPVSFLYWYKLQNFPNNILIKNYSHSKKKRSTANFKYRNQEGIQKLTPLAVRTVKKVFEKRKQSSQGGTNQHDTVKKELFKTPINDSSGNDHLSAESTQTVVAGNTSPQSAKSTDLATPKAVVISPSEATPDTVDAKKNHKPSFARVSLKYYDASHVRFDIEDERVTKYYEKRQQVHLHEYLRHHYEKKIIAETVKWCNHNLIVVNNISPSIVHFSDQVIRDLGPKFEGCTLEDLISSPPHRNLLAECVFLLMRSAHSLNGKRYEKVADYNRRKRWLSDARYRWKSMERPSKRRKKLPEKWRNIGN